MTISKSLAIAGLLVAATTVAKADPVVKLLTAGAKNGQTAHVTIWAAPGTDTGGTPINLISVALNFTIDTANASAGTTSPTVTPASGWVTQATNINGNQVSVVMTNNNGQNTPGPLATVDVTNTTGKSSVLTMLPSSTLGDDNFNQYNVAQSSASLLAGAVRQLGAPVSGSPSTGPGNVIAVVAGGKLNLLNAADANLADVAGFSGPVLSSGLAPISRPAFGVVNGTNVIAVATIDGKLALYNAATGAAVGTATAIAAGATNASSPAIDSTTGDIYVAASAGSGATLARFVGGAMGGAASMNGAAVTGSPAFVGGSVVAGTDTGLNRFTPSGSTVTPQANVTPGTVHIDTAPVLRGDGVGMVTSGNTVYLVNAINGNVIGTANAGAGVTALSEGWYDSATGTWFYGANDGKVYGFTAGAAGPVSAAGSPTTASTSAIGTQPLVINGTQYVVDVTGNFKRSTETTGVPIGGTPTPALAATGRGATDSVIVVEGNGGVAALPL